MTGHHEHDRDRQRATVAAFVDSYVCPDCHATKTLTELTAGVYALSVAHDETCPTYKAMTQ